MAEIECQYTGVRFSASSKRAKNHPVISQILADANRVGRYGLVLDALKKARVDGVTDIDEFRSRALDALTGDIARSNAERDAERQARREADATRERAKSERARTNAYLRQHGYCWRKVVASWETDPQDPEADYEFLLFAPDGRRVVPTVAQALDEIERGADVVLAEIAASIQAERDRRAAIAAEKADLVARMEVSYYRDLRAELDELHAWRDSFDGYLVKLETHIIELHAIMRAAGLTPPPRPSRPRRT